MGEFHYNLLDEPWIPVLDHQGRHTEVSLTAVFQRARELGAVQHDSPLVVAATYRLLLAILYRSLAPRDHRGWRQRWDNGEGTFDDPKVLGYLERWRARFDLFDAARPFLQDPQAGDHGKPSEPVSKLDFAAASGNNATLASHSLDKAPAQISPAAAVLQLLAFQGYVAGGRTTGEKESFKAGLLRTGYAVLVEGRSLWETLMLNLVPLNGAGEMSWATTPRDAPAWERPIPTRGEKRRPDGLVDLFTWVCRRVLFLPEVRHGAVVIRRAHLGGARQPVDEMPKEPLFSYAAAKKTGFVPVKPSPAKAAWRQIVAILERDRERGRPAWALDHLARLYEASDIPDDLPVGLTLRGLMSDKAKTVDWAEASTPLPKVLLTDADVLADVREALEAAEKTAGALKSSLGEGIKFLLALQADDGRAPAAQDVGAVLQTLSSPSVFWAAMEREFPRLLRGLSEDPGAALKAWSQRTRRAAREAFHIGAQQLGESPHAWKARAIAERDLNKRLHKLFPTTNPKETA